MSASESPPLPSPERIHELLERNLREVFEEADGERRLAAVNALWTPDGILYVPPGPVTGHEAIAKFAGDLRETHPTYTYTPHGRTQVLHDAGRLAWGSGPTGEEAVYTGLDLVIARGDKIAALYVFLDESSDEYRRSSGKRDT